MQDRSIDAFARNLARGVGRRRVAVGIAGALTGALVGPNAAFACKQTGKKCDKSGDCCHGAKCKGKKCVCKGTLGVCDGKCVDVLTDVEHCGRVTTRGARRNLLQRSLRRSPIGRRQLRRLHTRCADNGNASAAAASFLRAAARRAPTPALAAATSMRLRRLRLLANDGRGDGLRHRRARNVRRMQNQRDCAALGPGAFCVASGAACCGPDAQNTCRLPCAN